MDRDGFCDDFFFPDRRGTQWFPRRLNRMTDGAYHSVGSDSNADSKPALMDGLVIARVAGRR